MTDDHGAPCCFVGHLQEISFDVEIRGLFEHDNEELTLLEVIEQFIDAYGLPSMYDNDTVVADLLDGNRSYRNDRVPFDQWAQAIGVGRAPEATV